MPGIPLNMVNDVCLHGMKSEQCRYLAMEQNTQTWTCCKIMPDMKKIIDKEVDGLLRRYDEVKRKDHGLPSSDNCPGFGAR